VRRLELSSGQPLRFSSGSSYEAGAGTPNFTERLFPATRGAFCHILLRSAPWVSYYCTRRTAPPGDATRRSASSAHTAAARRDGDTAALHFSDTIADV